MADVVGNRNESTSSGASSIPPDSGRPTATNASEISFIANSRLSGAVPATRVMNSLFRMYFDDIMSSW